MKHLLYSLLLGSAVAFTSCSDKLNDKHDDPDAFTSTKIEYLFAQGAQKTIENDYGDMYTYTFRRFGNYVQVTARQTGTDRMNLYDIQSDLGRWENYYVTRMGSLTEIDKIYATLSSDEQAVYRNYAEGAKVLEAYNTAIATDFFGNMPYSEAFTARNAIYGGAVILKPKYDTQKDIYYSILDDLREAADYFKTNPASDDAFRRQDIIYSGDVAKWAKFANSLRLRYAMRISNVDPDKAKEVLGSLNVNDLIINNSDNAYLTVSGQDTAPDGIWRAMNESHSKSQGYYMYAPQGMVDRMTAAADPRLPVFFQPGVDDDGNVVDPTQPIKGYPSSADDAIALINSTPDNGVNLYKEYAAYSSITFRKNYHLPVGIGMTAAETYFCLAEAAARNLISGDAESYYNKGVILSIQNYYTYYKDSDATGKDANIVNADVSDATLSTWLAVSTYKFDSSKALEQIATQKWIHLNILQIYENWAEYRRTDLPVLDDDREKGSLLNKEKAPVRVLYPSKEASMNTANYNAQSEYNKISVRLWWDTK
ncbi:MAG: SusD/RagB family nutrient-binding outer membrane lipoprotein [Bacteroides sp.]|nr:SusD/RagB family nutrient-binding outer membrane lipoprotein [Bacteroides sp.]